MGTVQGEIDQNSISGYTYLRLCLAGRASEPPEFFLSVLHVYVSIMLPGMGVFM